MQLLQYYRHSFILLLFFPLLGYAQTRELWIDLPPAQWPTIGLINEVQYKNGDRYIDPSFRYAGTGFLINTGTDRYPGRDGKTHLVGSQKQTVLRRKHQWPATTMDHKQTMVPHF